MTCDMFTKAHQQDELSSNFFLYIALFFCEFCAGFQLHSISKKAWWMVGSVDTICQSVKFSKLPFALLFFCFCFLHWERFFINLILNVIRYNTDICNALFYCRSVNWWRFLCALPWAHTPFHRRTCIYASFISTQSSNSTQYIIIKRENNIQNKQRHVIARTRVCWMNKGHHHHRHHKTNLNLF